MDFARDALVTLCDYTRIECLSPAFDPDWASHGALERAAELLAAWCAARELPDLVAQVVRPEGRTPSVLVEVPGDAPGRALVYGHFDKQPPMGAWRDGLGPYEPVREGDRLYGRGTADDGYACFAALGALDDLAAAGRARPTTTVLLEGSEESGSPDLPATLALLADRLARPDLVVCLDSGCLTYDRIWTTASLRGNVVVTVTVEVLTEGVHSGLAGGVVPSSFRLLRRLLSRLEDERTGALLVSELTAPVPERHRQALAAVAAELGDTTVQFPTVPGLVLGGADAADRLVARAWRPALAVTGADGIPALGDAGNVLRPSTTLRLSVRTPPTVDAEAAGAAVVAALEADPPEGARVTATLDAVAQGWVAPDPEAWVEAALDAASAAAFGRPHATYGEGGTIPFLAELARRFPGTPLVALGVLGPGSNAHGPNEFLHLPMAEAVSAATAELLAGLAARPVS